MANNMIDFDQFLKERKRSYITVKVFGEEYKVKNELPAIVPIMIARAGEDADSGVIGNAIMQAGEVMFGAETIEKFCRMGMSAPELGTLIRLVFNRVSGQNVDGEDMGDEQSGDDASGSVAKPGKKARK